MKHRFQPSSTRVFLALYTAAIIAICGNSQLQASTEGGTSSRMLSQSPSVKLDNITSTSTTVPTSFIATKQESAQSPDNPLQATQQFFQAADAKWYILSIILLSLLSYVLFSFFSRMSNHGTSSPRGSLRRRRVRHGVEAVIPNSQPIHSQGSHTDQSDKTSSDNHNSPQSIDAIKQTEPSNTSAIRQLQSDVHEMKAELIRLAAAIEELQKPQDFTHQDVSATTDPSFTIEPPEGPPSAQQLLPQANESASASAGFAAYLASFTQADQEPPAQSTMQTPLEIITKEFQAAAQNRDRSLLRRITTAELNITSESEDSLIRGSVSHATQLRSVPGGGSYVLITVEERNWLFPTFLTLESFNTNQPAKGIFAYERQLVSSAELKLPAEVKEVGGLWEVVKQGIVIVPG